MRYLAILFFLLGLQHYSFGQSTPPNTDVTTLLTGKWQVATIDKGSKLSESKLQRLDKPVRGNYNIALYIFGADGAFRLESIHDYGSTSEIGTYTLSKDGKIIEREVKRANPWGRKKEKTISKESKILHLEKGKLVISTKNKVYYLKRGA